MLDTQAPVILADPVNRPHPLNRGLASWWLTLPGLDGGRQLFDIAGLNHGVLTNGPTWRGTTRPGGFGQLTFDGVNNFVNCGPLSFPGAITVAAWIRPDNAATATIASNYNAAGNAAQFDLDLNADGSITFLVQSATGQYRIWTTAAGLCPPGEWRHVLAAHDGTLGTGGVRVFVGGVSQSLTVTTGGSGSGTVPASAGNTAVGRLGSFDGEYFPGAIDDVRLYRRSLSDTEARALRDESRLGSPGTLNRLDIATLLTPGGPPKANPSALLACM